MTSWVQSVEPFNVDRSSSSPTETPFDVGVRQESTVRSDQAELDCGRFG